MKTIITITIDHTQLSQPMSRQLREQATPQSLTARINDHGRAVLDSALRVTPPDCVTVEHKAGWTAGWNIPGCQPESEPQVFDTFAEACEFLAGALSEAREYRASTADPDRPAAIRRIEDAYNQTITRVELAGKASEDVAQPFWVNVPGDRIVYWVAKEI